MSRSCEALSLAPSRTSSTPSTCDKSSSIFVNELLEAAGMGNVTGIGFFLNHGFNVNDKAIDGQTALCYAVRRDQIEAAKFLLDNDAEVNIVTYEGMFPLSIAVAHRNKEMVELLLERGASVHYPVYYEYFPPIHQAAMSGNFWCMDYLLQAGADIDQVDRYLGSVLMAVYEVEMEHRTKMDIIRFLLSHGADTNVEVRSKTMAKFAIARHDHELMELLVLSETDLSSAKEESGRFYRSDPYMITLVERSRRNPLKLQHLCRRRIVRRAASIRRMRAQRFAGVLDKTGVSIFARLNLPRAAVDYLEYKRICLSNAANGDYFH